MIVSSPDFVHLHVHSEFSILDGFSRIPQLVQQAKDYGMRHLAITDHGSMYGVIKFYQACQAAGINPVVGEEAYLVDDMSDRSASKLHEYHHLLLLAHNDIGYLNLMKLTTLAHTQGFYGRPRIDKNALSKYAEGLIATSSCLSGEIPKMLLRGDLERASNTVRWYQDTFGPENFYLELQEHHGEGSEQGRLNQLLYALHRDTSVPLVVTNDLHYVRADDAHAHDLMLCIQTGSQVDTPGRFKFDSPRDYCFKSAQQMHALFPDLPEALNNTLRIAERCEVKRVLGQAELPDYPIPPAFETQEHYLYHLCEQGARERFAHMSEEVRRQLDYEFSIIVQKGFVAYFLIVFDFTHYARSHNIRCSARGSAAGSLVAYLLGITNVDPLRAKLLFERFLNPERDSMPDVDMDFPDNKRDQVIAYITAKYGTDKVAQMVTFNTMAAKASVRDVARVLGWQALGDSIARIIPSGPHITLTGALASERLLAERYQREERVRTLVDQAQQLEGSIRATGIHAAGVVIARRPLEEVIPLQLRDTKAPEKGKVSQYGQKELETLGLLKMDLLGLSNLTILDTTLSYVMQTRREDIVLEHLPLDEIEGREEDNEKRRKAFGLLASGETNSIFQFEGTQMTAYLKQLRPTSIEDLTAMVALYRPGPMDSIPDFIAAKHGRKKVVYLDSRLEQWLAESYGVIVYQDQVLLIAVHLAGFSWGEVEKFRKAMSKKIKGEMEAYREKFITGCVMNQVASNVAERLYDLILPFSGYGFNKAHAASYAVVAYQTAWLKANYLIEFMSATLTVELSDSKKMAAAVAECDRMKVRVLPPDINASGSGFAVEGNSIRFGLLAIKGLGESPVGEVLRARGEGGPFSGLADLCTRTDPSRLARGALELLIKAGALDSLGPRNQVRHSLDRALKWGKKRRREAAQGMVSLFEDQEAGVQFALDERAPEMDQQQCLADEKALIGVYLSSHPLQALRTALLVRVTHITEMLSDEMVGERVVIGGLVAAVRPITTKKGDAMCIVTLQDLYGTFPVVVFPRVYSRTSELWSPERVILVRGQIQLGRDGLQLACDDATPFQVSETELNAPIRQLTLIVRIKGPTPEDQTAAATAVKQAQAILQEEAARLPGRDRYEIVLSGPEGAIRLTAPSNTFRYSSAIHRRLEWVMGADAIQLRVVPRECEVSSSI